jgi:hypothetical protein
MDVDTRNGGDDTLAELENRHGPLPDTLRVLTGGEGWHIYVTTPPGLGVRPTLGPGVDVKSDGGYVLAPPSRHVSGRGYAWLAECGPDEIEIAALPASWLAALRRASTVDASGDPLPPCSVPLAERVRRATAYVARCQPAISGQGGHARTFSVVLAIVRGFVFDADHARPILRAYSGRCVPPWSDREIEHKLRDALRARTPWGYLLDGSSRRGAA